MWKLAQTSVVYRRVSRTRSFKDFRFSSTSVGRKEQRNNCSIYLSNLQMVSIVHILILIVVELRDDSSQRHLNFIFKLKVALLRMSLSRVGFNFFFHFHHNFLHIFTRVSIKKNKNIFNKSELLFVPYAFVNNLWGKKHFDGSFVEKKPVKSQLR